MDAPGRSDSSAQVLSNSQPEFRLPGATRRGSYQIEYFLSGVDGFVAWVHDFVLLGLHNIYCRMAGVLAESRIWCKKVPFFTPTE